jgi:hypothetical protein
MKGESRGRDLPPEIQDIIANFTRDVNVQNTITTDYMRRRLRNERLQGSISRPYMYQIPRYRQRTNSDRIPRLRNTYTFEFDPQVMLDFGIGEPTEGNFRAHDDHWATFEIDRLFNNIYNNPPPYTYSSLVDRNNDRGRVLDSIETNPRTLRRRSSRKRPLSAPFRNSKRRRTKNKKKKKKNKKKKNTLI